jgi:hypothetical protein
VKHRKLLEKFSESLIEPGVSELIAGECAINPPFDLGSSGVINRR